MIIEQIKNKKYLENVICELKKNNPAADIQLLEKTVGALFLVESLVNQDLNFIFKGGTSLVLLLEHLKRFSVDVDIITEESKEKVKEKINNIINEQTLFIRVEQNVRENSASQRMDLEHYKFFFNSVTDNSEKYILLDVAYEGNKYPEVLNKKIECKELLVHSDLCVNIPSIESILGDKLTVIAPFTTGIGYNSNKELELIKQLYDVDKLFDLANNLDIIKTSFINISNRELKYRKLSKTTYNDVLEDIEKFAQNIIFRENKNQIDIINIGIKKFSGYRIEKKFLIDKEVLIAAGKVLYLVFLIRNNKDIIEKYKNGIENSEDIIPDKYKKRMKVIKKINEEAYFYIIKTFLNS